MARTKAMKQYDPEKPGFGRSLAWNLSGISTTSAYIIVSSYMSLYCTDYLGLSIGTVGILLMVSKIIDAFTDLIAGYVIDKTNTKLGKGRPYELATLGLWFATILMYSTPESFGRVARYIWVFTMYIFIYSIFGTIQGAGTTPYMIRAFGSQKAVSKVASFGGIITAISGVAVSIVFPIALSHIAIDLAGWRRLILIFAIPLALIGMLRFIFVKEVFPVEEDKKEHLKLKDVITLLKSNPYIWILGAAFLIKGITSNLGVGTYYFKYIVGDISKQGTLSIISLVGMLLMVFFPMLLRKYKTSQIMAGCAGLAVVGSIIAWFAGANMLLLMIAAFFGSFASLPLMVFSVPMIMDCITYNEYNNHPRMDATMTAITNFLNKVGGGIGGGLMGLALSAAGYDGTLSVQPDSAIGMIHFGYSLLPGIFHILTIVVAIAFFQFQKKLPEMRNAIQARREQGA